VIGELVSGRGLAAAVADVAVIVHCASNPLRPRVDIDGTRNLVEAAREAGIWHLVDISIVGVDRVPSRYYQAKLQAERLIQASGLPWTILRATQFHQLVLLVAEHLARLPIVPVPAATSFQPIDAAEVADRLASLAAGPRPAGCPTWAAPRSAPPPTWCAPTCVWPGGGQCCRSTCLGRCSRATARAATSPPTTRSGTAPGRCS
jgi:putative NAD(P)-binding protein